MKWQKGEREDAKDSIAIQVGAGRSAVNSYTMMYREGSIVTA